jgi:phosphohistidine phosphatase
LIRHGIAEDRDDFAKTGKNDAVRPLTPVGRKKMKHAAAVLRRVLRSIDVLGSSPLLRAMQTAEIIAKEYGGIDIVRIPALVPGKSPEEFRAWLRGQRSEASIAVVGHEPDLGEVATWLLCGQRESRIHIGKGGVCALELPGSADAGTAELRWLLTPELLRKLPD